MHAILEYTYGDDYLDAREQFRAVHLAAALAAVERGELLLGGAVGDGPYTGLLVFQGDDALTAARRFAESDPYVLNGLVKAWNARPWTTVVGAGASAPVDTATPASPTASADPAPPRGPRPDRSPADPTRPTA